MYSNWISTLQKVQKAKKIGSNTERLGRLADKAILSITKLIVLLDDTELMNGDCSLVCSDYQITAELIMKTAIEFCDLRQEKTNNLRELYEELDSKIPIPATDEKLRSLDRISICSDAFTYSQKMSHFELMNHASVINSLLQTYIQHMENNC